MRKIALTALAALSVGSVEAQAADYGIGVSVQSDDAIIYAPIDINDKLRIEPNLRYQQNEIETDGGDFEIKTLELGVGVFGLSTVSKSVRFYYGGRVTYLDQEIDQPGFVIDADQDADGFRISPTIGFEFLFNERLSLGGEAEYFFQDVDSDTGDTENSGTDTRLILRFKF